MEVLTGAADEFGHGGTPTAFDRVLTTRLGLATTRAAHTGAWGMMTSLHGNEINLVALADAGRRGTQSANRGVREPRRAVRMSGSTL